MTKKLETILAKHQSKFRTTAYSEYSESELSHAIGFFAVRATHRVDIPKAKKDLIDAGNYLEMLRTKIIG